MKQKENFIKLAFESGVGGVFAMLIGMIYLLPAIFLEEGLNQVGMLTSNYWFWLWAGCSGGFMFGKFAGAREREKEESNSKS